MIFLHQVINAGEHPLHEEEKMENASGKKSW